MIEHDVYPGHLTRCQISGSTNLEMVLDLGHQPLCDSLLDNKSIHEPELTYPLRLNYCLDSGLAQLDYIVDGSVVYHPEYPYRSGISKPLEEYQIAFADSIIAHLGVPEDGFCVDIGSNDGTLLTGFKRHGRRTLGVEPTNIAEIARTENGIETIQQFFTENLAESIVRDYGHAKIVTMTNVFAHMALLGEVMRGIQKLLDKDGVFITESHYLLDVVQKTQFETVYHEHIRTYSLKSLMLLMSYYGMEVFKVERGERYGGNIRVYVARKHSRIIDSSVGKLMVLEEESGLHKLQTYVDFKKRVYKLKSQFMELAYNAQKQGMSFVGNSCPGRCSTLLNYYGVTVDLMPYICELPTSLKLNKYVPGRHIPVVNNSRLLKEQPDYVVLLAWHYAPYMLEQLRIAGLKSQLVVPLPELRVLSV